MKNNFNKKGVSTIVANVLIILLVVVGVALIWAAVRPSIEEGSEGIQADCFTAQVETTGCTPDTSTATLNDWEVTVKRNPGAGDLTGLKFRFENAAGTVTEIDDQLTAQLDELESKPFTSAALTQLTGPICGGAVTACSSLTSTGAGTCATQQAGCGDPITGNTCSGTATGTCVGTTSALCTGVLGCVWNAGPAKVSVAALVGPQQRVCDIISSPVTCS